MSVPGKRASSWRGLLVALTACGALAVSAPALGAPTARGLAEAIASRSGLEAGECPGALAKALGADHVLVCGPGKRGFKGFAKRLDALLAEAELARGEVVLDWHASANGRRKVWWLGESSLQAFFDDDASRAAIAVSRSYPRCGSDTPFVPLGFEQAGQEPGRFLQLEPSSYPQRAAAEKLDGSVALAVDVGDDGQARVRCIHHASPAGWGFEFPALEAVHDTPLLLPEDDGPGGPLTILVLFSKADERPRGVRIRYH